MKMLFLFLDGVGLGPDDSESNPFAGANLPNLKQILGGKKLVRETLGPDLSPWITSQATLLGLDAVMGIAGKPQSASGQATILTGKNIPANLGKHYGPKPNPEIRKILREGTLFSYLKSKGFNTTLLNAFPQGYFDALDSGRRLPGAIAMAILEAGLPLKTTADLLSREALSADFTAQGWRDRLNIPEIPVLTPVSAGEQMARLSQKIDFAFFEYWLSDYAGHRAKFPAACELLETFDEMLGGLVAIWDFSAGLIFITSDHGNLEDMNTRRHTTNLVPGLVIGDHKLRAKFCQNLRDLTDIYPAIVAGFDAK
jgi:2,3-bisphosphoglycerate-independent phosphoglycerate mutase